MKNPLILLAICLLPIASFSQKGKKNTEKKFKKAFMNKEWKPVRDAVDSNYYVYWGTVLNTFNDSISLVSASYTAPSESYYSQEKGEYIVNTTDDTIISYFTEVCAYELTIKDNLFWIHLIYPDPLETEYLMGYFIDKRHIRIGFSNEFIPAEKETGEANWSGFIY